MNNAPPPPPKSNVLAVVPGAIGLLVVLLVGTCAVGAVYLQNKGKEFAENILDAGMVLDAPPEVKAELAGAKKDYVGSWTSLSGRSSLSIDSDGNFSLVKREGVATETYTMPIAAFRGNDIELKAVVTLNIDVPEPPHQVGGKWRMKAKGVTFQR